MWMKNDLTSIFWQMWLIIWKNCTRVAFFFFNLHMYLKWLHRTLRSFCSYWLAAFTRWQFNSHGSAGTAARVAQVCRKHRPGGHQGRQEWIDVCLLFSFFFLSHITIRTINKFRQQRAKHLFPWHAINHRLISHFDWPDCKDAGVKYFGLPFSFNSP